MNIRIGNDIRLNVTLIAKGAVDVVNIQSLTAYIINASVQKQAVKDLENKTRFISRYPLEPYVDAYSSTAYDIKSSGYPIYNAFPKNYVHHPYAGFGVNPVWDKIYHPVPDRNLTEYKAEVRATSMRDTVEVYFPAEALLYTGSYNIVIVAKIYEPGYSNNNLRTVTMDYENVFVLVNTSEEGVDSNVTLNVGSGKGQFESGAAVAESVIVNGNALIHVGQTGTAYATVYPANIRDNTVTWFTSNEDSYVVTNTAGELDDRVSVLMLECSADKLPLLDGRYTKKDFVDAFGATYTSVTKDVYVQDSDNGNLVVENGIRTSVNVLLESLDILNNNESLWIGVRYTHGSGENQRARLIYMKLTKQVAPEHLRITHCTGNTVYYKALSLPEGETSHDVILYAKSNQTNYVLGLMKVTIIQAIEEDTEEERKDIYVRDGKSDEDSITLFMTDGTEVDIDATPLINDLWYDAGA